MRFDFCLGKEDSSSARRGQEVPASPLRRHSPALATACLGPATSLPPRAANCAPHELLLPPTLGSLSAPTLSTRLTPRSARGGAPSRPTSAPMSARRAANAARQVDKAGAAPGLHEGVVVLGAKPGLGETWLQKVAERDA